MKKYNKKTEYVIYIYMSKKYTYIIMSFYWKIGVLYNFTFCHPFAEDPVQCHAMKQ